MLAHDTRTPHWRLWLGLAVLILLVIVLRRAWLSDDAFITFRTLDNFLNGYGLRWNIAERVQSYTHPLWLFSLVPLSWLTQHIAFSALAMSLFFTSGAVGLMVWRAASGWGALLGVAVLAFSNAFVDYATSGLENPLTFLLLAGFMAVFLRMAFTPRVLLILSLLSSLALVNRMDSFLFYAVALLYAFLRTPDKPRALLWMAVGQLPFLAWEIFSLLYYGFPFPNTYYAKLGASIPSQELLVQGFAYFKDSLTRDPATLSLIAMSALTVLWRGQRGRKLAMLLGVGLYLLYIMRIGGDFMSGRFFAAPLFVAAFLLASLDAPDLSPRALFGGLLAWVVGVGALFTPLPTFQLEEPTPSELRPITDIVDERSHYTRGNLLRQDRLSMLMPDMPSPMVDVERIIFPVRSAGRAGMWAGRGAHVVDLFGLGDPLLARLPAVYDPNWRIGHFLRVMPEGYHETLDTGENQLVDEALASYYDQLALITRGELFDPARLQAILAMNLGQYDHLIDTRAYRFDSATRLTDGDLLAMERGEQAPLDCERGVRIGTQGVMVRFAQAWQAPTVTVRLVASPLEEEVFVRVVLWSQDGRAMETHMLLGMYSTHVIRLQPQTSEQGVREVQLLMLDRRDVMCVVGVSAP